MLKNKVKIKGGDMGLQETLKALADPTRREILNMLKKGSMTAGSICEQFDMTGASVSRHLSVLRNADLIRDRREGKFIRYELNASVLDEALLWITSLKEDYDYNEKQIKNSNMDSDTDFLCGYSGSSVRSPR